ncbi:hypothetical protein A1D29_05305 [Pasteurellaceae bacterium Orientalotternb1]|nr:hypothetical protein A1D29_05305 [Pasteurellaceae bacterium Orientalotternb1]
MEKITLLSTNYDDYHLGFEVQATTPQFLSWDMTYDEIIALPCVEWDAPLFSDFEIHDDYFFKYPVRVGNILLHQFGFCLRYDQPTNMAVQTYYAESEKGVSKWDFQQVHHQLARHLTFESQAHFHQNGSSSFYKNEIAFTVGYYGEPQYQQLYFLCNHR